MPRSLWVLVVGQPKLALSLSSSVIVGQKNTLTVYAQDANGSYRVVAQPLTLTVASSAPSHTAFDSSTITIPVGAYYVQTGVTFDTAGSYTITAGASNYTGASQSTTATGALVTMVVPTTFSPANVTIAAGQYVTWKNGDTVNHTTTSDTGVWDSGPDDTGTDLHRLLPRAGNLPLPLHDPRGGHERGHNGAVTLLRLA